MESSSTGASGTDPAAALSGDIAAPAFADLAAAHRATAEEVLRRAATDPRDGLSESEAAARLRRFGPNQLGGERPVPAWRKLARQFADALVLLFVAAAGVSTVLWFLEGAHGLPYEAFAIVAIVLFNAVLGYLQQARAERAVQALRQMSAPQATVMRSGQRRRIASAGVVPGDIMLLEEGDLVAADGRLIEAAALQTAEAALTGESVPVAKDTAPVPADAVVGDRDNMAFSGTAVVGGRGRAVVTATGMASEMGRIAGLLAQAPEETTPLQRELDRLGRILGRIVIAVAVVMIGAILLVEDVAGLPALFDILILGVALAVAAVPEGLPAVVTAVLSIGVQRMAGRNAILRRLAAVETLGSADVIASDKTGTLTRNEMTVRRLVTASGGVDFDGTGYAPQGAVRLQPSRGGETALRAEMERALAAAARANNAVLTEAGGRWSVHGDPTEGALLAAARKAGLAAPELEARFMRIGEVPFSSERKLMSTIEADAERDRPRAFTKGAPDVLLGHCSHELVGDRVRELTAERRAAIMADNEALAGAALRTLGLAFRSLPGDAGSVDVEQGLVFLGLAGMLDPPREEARVAVARAKAAGIRPIMITGDHPRTAAVIAAELGIGDGGRAVSGAELAAMSGEVLVRTVRQASVYARVDPVHKLRIVEALHEAGSIVAMTGDGINDAPALKAADIGVAMGVTGTDVSKEAADMILADDNFATIVAAVEEGRAIFSNIRKFLRYLLSSNVGEVMTMFFGLLLADVIGLAAADGSLVLPLLATQILWINLVTDGAPALALGVDPAAPDIMRQPPRRRGEGVITAEMWAGILLVGAVMAAGTLAVLDASLPGGMIEGTGTVDEARTMAFTTLTLFQLFNVFNARSDRRSAFADLFRNGWLWAAVAVSVGLQVAVVYAPALQQAFSTVGLGWRDWLFCAAVASSVLWTREAAKLVRRLF